MGLDHRAEEWTMTPMPTFERIATGLDVQPLLGLLELKSELWDEIIVRQKVQGSPHKNTECIFVRGPEEFSVDKYFYDLGSYDYPAIKILEQAIVPLLKPLLTEVLRVTELGRVLIVKFKPGGHIDKHVDEGTYADYFARFHVVLKTNPRATLTVGGHERNLGAGEAWYFNHKLEHYGDNKGDEDRIHIIFDAVTELYPMVSVPTT